MTRYIYIVTVGQSETRGAPMSRAQAIDFGGRIAAGLRRAYASVDWRIEAV